ncbi:MAG: ammonia-forming cytochrome c nitrite reductase subunit c552 [Acidobacteria bacterium]|nr:ammonia-forming cytochrome c nitrite reductase subunit c552 [Acidobacteriota bacterium]
MENEENTVSNKAPAKSRLYGGKVVVSVAFLAFAAAILGLGLLTNILERKNEAKNPFFRVVELTDDTTDPEVWGKNFPLQYDGYKKTVDQVRTRFGGSEAVHKTPKDSDPRSMVAQSRLEEDPRLKTMWDGYAFAVDFREERGHAFMLEDQMFTERQNVVKQPGSCINCHASAYAAYKKLGGGDIVAGFQALNKLPYFEAKKEISHPVACIDCHDSQTMALRITRPAFMDGIKAYKASQGIQNYDVNRDATRQEMRSYVCGQCHVEYYFKGADKQLTYPWEKGLKVENIMAYYDEVKHKDWSHKQTGAEVLKAQHPEFEMFNQGIHSRAGVSCADCHMPYKREGAMKISDHHVRSPLLNISQSCQTCHSTSEAELKFRAEAIQERTFNMRNIAMDALVQLIDDLRKAKERGATDEDLAAARDFQRKAQFYLDFVEAENSMGFHAPAEAVRILGESVNFTRQGQLSLKNGKTMLATAAAH